jgi:hypothetical protein
MSRPPPRRSTRPAAQRAGRHADRRHPAPPARRDGPRRDPPRPDPGRARPDLAQVRPEARTLEVPGLTAPLDAANVDMLRWHGARQRLGRHRAGPA